MSVFPNPTSPASSNSRMIVVTSVGLSTHAKLWRWLGIPFFSIIRMLFMFRENGNHLPSASDVISCASLVHVAGRWTRVVSNWWSRCSTSWSRFPRWVGSVHGRLHWGMCVIRRYEAKYQLHFSNHHFQTKTLETKCWVTPNDGNGDGGMYIDHNTWAQGCRKIHPKGP